MAEVKVGENESIESALRRFKKKIQKAGILSEVKKRERYEKPSVKRKHKSEAARKRKVYAVRIKDKSESISNFCNRHYFYLIILKPTIEFAEILNHLYSAKYGILHSQSLLLQSQSSSIRVIWASLNEIMQSLQFSHCSL